VAYSLYLLEHNAELQQRLLHRLKDPRQFQGAYYELLVANALIRAGFELSLEDETDSDTKHCEFAATSKATGKKYWVEAKMRAVKGMLGRTKDDGGHNDTPLARIIPHLNNALAKPAIDERLIFIDVNVEMSPDINDENRPAFVRKARERLERFDAEGRANGKSAYVFVTNITFHRSLRGPAVLAVAPYGLGIPDFNKAGEFRMSERYMQERKHSDAIRIADALSELAKFPSTFDGKLPSEAYDQSQRVFIGMSYDFGGDIGVATVTAATVMDAENCAVLGITRTTGDSMIIKKPMTEAELTDYRENSDAYFGVLEPKQRVNKTPYEFFQSLMDIHLKWSREQILQQMKGYTNFEELKALPHEHLVAIYCEGLVAMVQAGIVRLTQRATWPRISSNSFQRVIGWLIHKTALTS
jgi:hypothetical protein